MALSMGPAASKLQRSPRPVRRPTVQVRAQARPLPVRPVSVTATPLLRPAATPRSAEAQQKTFRPTAALPLKLVASALVGAAITLAFWQSHSPVQKTLPLIADNDSQESVIYPRTRLRLRHPAIDREADSADTETEIGEIPSNFPRRVRTLTFTPPVRYVASPRGDNRLAGKQLRYLIGTDSGARIGDDDIVEVSYDTSRPARHGISIAYCNLFDERNTGRYGPYLKSSDTAKEYNEGQIDPHGPGWEKNLREQFALRKQQGFEYIELDNPDAYSVRDVVGAIDLAASYGLKVIAKNPMLLESGAATYVAHPNVYGIIVERGAGGAVELEALRRKAGKPHLPTWFVSFGSGRKWANGVASKAKHYKNMGVTYSSAGEYGNSIDVLAPSEGTGEADKAM